MRVSGERSASPGLGGAKGEYAKFHRQRIDDQGTELIERKVELIWDTLRHIHDGRAKTH